MKPAERNMDHLLGFAFWISTGRISFCSLARGGARMASRICSSLASSGQPNHAFLPFAAIWLLTIGFITSVAPVKVKNRFQPPSFGGF